MYRTKFFSTFTHFSTHIPSRPRCGWKKLKLYTFLSEMKSFSVSYKSFMVHSTVLACIFLFMLCGGPVESVYTVSIRDLTPNEMEVVGAANAFGIKLISKLSTLDEKGDNIFISPLSVSIALGMALHGSDGRTREEMKEVLGFYNLSIDDINQSYRGLIDLLPFVDPSVKMMIANSIWYRYTFPVLKEFIETNKKYFDAEVQALDFSNPEAPGVINDWVKNKTNGLIEEIAPDPIDPLTMMFLINAVYFRSNWTYEFDKNKTENADFYLIDGTTIPVKMMTQKSEFRYFQSQNVDIIEIPYGDKLFSMIVILPPTDQSIHDFVTSMTGEQWRVWLGLLPDSEREIDLYLPRFKLEYETSLVDVLKALDMNLAFDPVAADFTALYDKSVEPRNAYISDVIHKTFVEVNEEGTEAAAVTSVVIGVDSVPPAFRVDRPFLFAIRERTSDTILFIGKVVRPESK
jgi:serine protease inhibitor